MHYKNGRPAKNGDKIVLITEYGNPIVGILYDAIPGNGYCNGYIATMTGQIANLSECLHIEDVRAAVKTVEPYQEENPSVGTTEG